MSLLEVDKQLWVGTFGGGVSRFDARTRRFENLRAGPEDGLHLSSGRVTALARDRTGHVWIGTDGGGLNVWDVQDAPAALLQARRQAARFAAAPTRIFRILVDDAGGVWIGTRGGGLDRVLNPGRRARASALRQHLRSRRACPTTPSTACAPTARATSGSAPTSAWRASIRRSTRHPALPSPAWPAGRGIQFRRALPRPQRQVVLRRRRRLQLLLPRGAGIQRAPAARGAHAIPEAQRRPASPAFPKNASSACRLSAQGRRHHSASSPRSTSPIRAPTATNTSWTASTATGSRPTNAAPPPTPTCPVANTCSACAPATATACGARRTWRCRSTWRRLPGSRPGPTPATRCSPRSMLLAVWYAQQRRIARAAT